MSSFMSNSASYLAASERILAKAPLSVSHIAPRDRGHRNASPARDNFSSTLSGSPCSLALPLFPNVVRGEIGGEVGERGERGEGGERRGALSKDNESLGRALVGKVMTGDALAASSASVTFCLRITTSSLRAPTSSLRVVTSVVARTRLSSSMVS